jgi:hypothetical protein
MDELAVDASPRIAQMDELVDSLVFDHLPRPIARTKTAANPARHTPDPPTGDFGVKELRIALEALLQRLFSSHEPRMPGMKIVLIDRPIGMMRDGGGIGLQGAPEI